MESSKLVRLSIVIPAFNEAGRLPRTLELVESYIASARHWLPAEIIVVDDGSSDDTFHLAQSTGGHSSLERRVLRHDHNRGKGAAVCTGLRSSIGRQVLISDADLATPIEEVERFAQAPENHLVIGSRACDRNLIEIRQPWWRDRLGRGFNLIVRSIVGLPFSDTQCGFKLLPGWFARSTGEGLTTEGFAFDVEMLVLAQAWEVEVTEVGVHWRHVEVSKVSPLQHSVEMLREVLRIRRLARAGLLPIRPQGAPLPTCEKS
ncbi:MAG: glycosyltransferase family 2 protein [bacterium]|nr:glycosyltransferase family 2 protein [bacterium]